MSHGFIVQVYFFPSLVYSIISLSVLPYRNIHYHSTNSNVCIKRFSSRSCVYSMHLRSSSGWPTGRVYLGLSWFNTESPVVWEPCRPRQTGTAGHLGESYPWQGTLSHSLKNFKLTFPLLLLSLFLHCVQLYWFLHKFPPSFPNSKHHNPLSQET